MSHVRAIFRLSRFLTFTAWCAIPLLANLVRDPQSKAQIERNTAVLRRWSRGSLRRLGVHVAAEGSPPDAPAMLVSNHLSYLDILVLASECNAVFIAKSEIGRWPVIGTLTRNVGTILIDRVSRRDLKRVMGEMARNLQADRIVVLFPEGTTSCGEAVDDFKPSLLQPSIDSQQPVHFASLHYSIPSGEASTRDRVHWWGDMTLVDHIYGLMRLEGVVVRVIYGNEPVAATDRRQLADTLWQRVSSSYADMRRSHERVSTAPDL